MSSTELVKLWSLFITSAVISIIYYRIVGYNLFSEALLGNTEDFTTRRLASYSGSDYAGAGIVNQFKNTVLPVAFFSILFYYYKYFRARFVIAFIIVTPLFIYCILGTGQRGYLFISLLIALIYYFNAKEKSTVLLSTFFLAFIILFGLYSTLLGRTGDSSFYGSISNLLYRIFTAQQIGGVIGLRYLYLEPTAWGYEWWLTLVGFIPGVEGSDLSHRLHEVLFGSRRGTVPVSLWISMYYNVGWLGIAPATAAVMWFITKVHRYTLSMERTVYNDIISSALTVYLAIIPFAGPLQIVNNGILGVILTIIIMRSAGRKRGRQAPSRYNLGAKPMSASDP